MSVAHARQLSGDIVMGWAVRNVGDAVAQQRVAKTLEPFFAIADSPGRKYPLAVLTYLPNRLYAPSVRALFGRRLKDVVHISASHPLERPPWMNDDAYRDLVVGALNEGLSDSLEQPRWLEAVGGELKSQVPVEASDELLELLSGTDFCHAPLESHFSPEWWDRGLDQHFGDTLWMSLSDAVAAYLYAEAAENDDRAKGFAALLKSMRTSIPVGFLADAPNTLVVISA